MGEVALSLESTGLSPDQLDRLHAWLPGAELLGEHSWGLVDTVVLRVREQDRQGHQGHQGRELTVKAFGPGNHHLDRELNAHRHFLAPLRADERAPTLVHADTDARLLVTTWLPGELVQGHPAEADPDTYRQAGALLARLHHQPALQRRSTTWLAGQRDRALRWLAQPHRIPQHQVAAVRAWDWPTGTVTLAPTHGDYQPRNWVVDDGRVAVIDLGRADLRPPATDLARMQARQWRGRPDLEQAFLDGYGADPRPPWWVSTLLAEAVGAAAWAHQVGDEAFEAEGLRSLTELLEGPGPTSAGRATGLG